MRHRNKGRKLGRNPSHQRALLRMLACSLILTEADYSDASEERLKAAPKVQGRIITTLPKAKEVRPYIEKLITLAKKTVASKAEAETLSCKSERGSEAWKTWRASENYKQWQVASAPIVTAKRRAFSMLRDQEAVNILFGIIAPRFVERQGGYTRILKLATPRLGDSGDRAILEFVGKNDRVKAEVTRPSFDDAAETEAPSADTAAVEA